MVAPACLAQSLGKESFAAFVALVGKLGAPEDVAGCGPHVQKAWYVAGFHCVCFAQVIFVSFSSWHFLWRPSGLWLVDWFLGLICAAGHLYVQLWRCMGQLHLGIS